MPYLAVRELLRLLAGITPELDEQDAGAQLVPWVNGCCRTSRPGCRCSPSRSERKSPQRGRRIGSTRASGASASTTPWSNYSHGLEAADFYRRSHEAKERSGDVEGSVMGLNNQAEILCDQGRLEEAEPLFRDALRIARAARLTLIEGFVTGNLGRIKARSLCFDEAHALLDEASEKVTAIGSAAVTVEIDARRAECLVLEGRHTESLGHARQALGRAEELGLKNLEPSLERMVGYALVQARLPVEALPHFERSLELARASRARYEVALTLEALADSAVRLALSSPSSASSPRRACLFPRPPPITATNGLGISGMRTRHGVEQVPALRAEEAATCRS